MRCPQCHFDNQVGDVFCSECGTRLEAAAPMRTCRRCAAVTSLDARFCHMCAAPLEGEPAVSAIPAAPAPAPASASHEPVAASGATSPPSPAPPRAPARSPSTLALALLGLAGCVGGFAVTSQLVGTPPPSPSASVSSPVSSASSPSPSPTLRAAPPLDERKIVRLSGIKVRASSHERPFEPSRVLDGKVDTFWRSGEVSGEDWLLLDFKRRVLVSRVGIVCGRVDAGDDGFRDNSRIRTVRLVLDGGVEIQGTLSDATKMQFIPLKAPSATTRLRIVITSERKGRRFQQGIIPEVEVWGREG